MKRNFFNIRYIKFLFFTYNGRLGRLDLILAILAVMVFFTISYFVLYFVLFQLTGNPISAFSYTDKIHYLAGLYITTSLYIKRLHDTGRTGMFILFIFVPILNLLLLLFLLFVRGDPDINKYDLDVLDTDYLNGNTKKIKIENSTHIWTKKLQVKNLIGKKITVEKSTEMFVDEMILNVNETYDDFYNKILDDLQQFGNNTIALKELDKKRIKTYYFLLITNLSASPVNNLFDKPYNDKILESISATIHVYLDNVSGFSPLLFAKIYKDYLKTIKLVQNGEFLLTPQNAVVGVFIEHLNLTKYEGTLTKTNTLNAEFLLVISDTLLSHVDIDWWQRFKIQYEIIFS
jgi:uncharacterized membrane protein YhaH (DUF805 family)